MTGRGNGMLIRPSSNPDVQIGISITTSPPVLDASSTSPFYIVIKARFLQSPIPECPITLQAYLNPFEPLPNRSITNIVCISSPNSTSINKFIEIAPRGWPNYNTGEKDWRKKWNYFTIHPNEGYIVRHEVSREKIEACGVKPGERYRVELTNKALGSRFWCWGDLQDMDGVRFGNGPYSRRAFEDEGMEDYWDESYGEETVWLRGEATEKLALVVEKGVAEFDVV